MRKISTGSPNHQQQNTRKSGSQLRRTGIEYLKCGTSQEGYL